MKHVLLWTNDSQADLLAELGSVLKGSKSWVHPAGLLELELACTEAQSGALPQLAFARQLLPFAQPAVAKSINQWAALLAQSIQSKLPEGLPWSLHVEPHYGESSACRVGARAWHSMRKYSDQPLHIQKDAERVDRAAGRRRCNLIREAVLEILRRRCKVSLKHLRREPGNFREMDSLAQLVLISPDAGFLSMASRPLPYEMRHILSPYPLGNIPIPADPQAPSRAFTKLVEAELKLGHAISSGQTCVDLGAAPGGWSYVALQRGAIVTAVDRSPLRPDLMNDRALSFIPSDAFTFRPSQTVDWLLCDVIAEPNRSAALLLKWLEAGWCRRFVVTLKFKGPPDLGVLAELRAKMPGFSCEWRMKRLCANKNEVCVFGTRD